MPSNEKVFTFMVFFLLSTLASYMSMLITVNILSASFLPSLVKFSKSALKYVVDGELNSVSLAPLCTT